MPDYGEPPLAEFLARLLFELGHLRREVIGMQERAQAYAARSAEMPSAGAPAPVALSMIDEARGLIRGTQTDLSAIAGMLNAIAT